MLIACSAVAFTAVAVPLGASATSRDFALSGVSCVSATDCVVVGSSTSSAGGPQPSTTLVLGWNGTKWSNLNGVNRSGFDINSLSDVSCTTPDFCMAVGESAKTRNSSAGEALIERWDGKTWTLVPSRATVQAVSCVTRQFCMGTTVTSLQRWDGTKWAAIAAPPVQGMPRYGGVACVDAQRCIAVASYDTGEYQSHIVAYLWNGKRWSQSPVSDPDVSESAGFRDAACGSRVSCVAVGSGTNGFYSYGVFAQHWDGNGWSQSAAGAPTSIVSELNGVACPSPTTCLAAGDLQSGPGPAGYPHPFVDRSNGTKWSVVSTPNLYGGLADIDCATSTKCLAIGYSQPDPNLYFYKTLVLRFDGTTWKRIPSPNPQ
jgi:hypothetical protein